MVNNKKRKCDIGYYMSIGIVVLFCTLILIVGFLVISSKAAELMNYRKVEIVGKNYNISDMVVPVKKVIDVVGKVNVDEEILQSLTTTDTDEEELIDAISDVPEYTEYTVEAGDSYWAIASQFYGDGSKYTIIMDDNESKPLHPGDVVKVYTSNIPVAAETPKKVVATINYATVTSNTTSSDGTKPDWTTYKDTTQHDTSNMTYVGNWKVTGYDPHCAHCCSKTDGITASGNQAVLGYSVGTNTLPLGTIVYVEGYGIFRVDDRGSGVTEVIDIACDTHDICYQMTGRANVYIVNQ